MTATAGFCSYSWCRNTTHDPSGRCYRHRSSDDPDVPRAPLPPPSLALTPGMTRAELDTGGYEEHYDAGCPHRPGRPDVVEYDSDGVLVCDYWFDENGEPHRVDGPSSRSYFQTGEIFIETYRVHGDLHRTDGPAIFRAHKDGSPWAEDFYEHGKKHRLDGPAETRHDEEGKLVRAEYFRDDRRSRIDGPAVIDEGGYKAFYLGGMRYDTFTDLARKAASQPDAITRADLEGTLIEPLVTEFGLRPVLDVLVTGVRTPEGIREVIGGAPAEWVRSFEESRAS